MNKIETVRTYLLDNYANRLRYDVVSDKLELCTSATDPTDVSAHWRELTKRDINSIVCACCAESGKNITDREVRCVLQSDFVPQEHPPRAYLDNLPAYVPVEGQTPLDYLASQVTVQGDEQEQQRWRDTFIRWFVAMVACWRSDDIVNQHVLVLIGPQGIFKTTWLERLIPPCLRTYSTKMANIRDLNKDERLRVAESVLINMDEIDSMSDRELNQMKSLITTADVNERAAYGYTKERKVRLASFCASGNKDQFLTDTTGNRRWLPFRVQSIQNPYDNPLQPWDMYYAQAIYMIDHGYAYWFDQERIQSLAEHVESFHKETSEEQLLPIFYSPATKDTPDAVFRTAAEISAKLSYEGNIRQPMSLTALGKLLTASGFVPKRFGHAGTRGYIVTELSNNQVVAHERVSQIEHDSEEIADSADSIF
ncbi:MAG: virulence-associated E family protein [Paludibacteraceae bacterium]|nr:virulence-associated E family protein [Paludibacteraceae bacterium]